LRDYQNLLWMSFFKYRTRTLGDLESRGLISGEENRQLGDAYDFLLRVRNELHYQSNRAADVVARPLQPRLAHNLGYTHRSPVRRLEEFMRDLYIHMRHVYLITRTLEQRLAFLPDPQRRMPSLRQLLRRGRQRLHRQVMDGFEFADGVVRTLTPRVFQEEPRRLLRVFLYAQQRGLGLHPDLAQLIRQQLPLVDEDFRNDPGSRQAFLEILDQRGNVAAAARGMHETGLLGRYLPEFEPLTCLVQHEFYHQYATDEHTLQCLEHLDRVWEAQEPPYRHYAEAFQSLERPYVLYLALLLHDAGKARREADHAVSGARLALAAARRLGLDASTTEALQLLILHHLLMSRISQRRDLDDPSVIRNFATQVGTVERLKMLTLHTLADSLGTSDRLWNGFKDSLLQQLYRKTLDHMEGTGVFVEADTRRREVLAQAVHRLLAGDLDEAEVESHFRFLPPRYFEIHEAHAIERDLRLVHRFICRQLNLGTDPLEPELAWSEEPDRGCARLRVCTWDRPGLFGKITGTLTAAGMNILDAQIFTRLDSIVIDTFAVVEARTGVLPTRETQRNCERLFVQVLGTAGDTAELKERIAHRPALPALYYSVEGARVPTTVRFDNETSDYYTIIDLEAEDHVGLLYAVTRELAELGLDISLARVNTERGAAMDTFYVTEVGGRKVTDPERERIISRRLQQAIASVG
jgi:[protein-PII] uridylyltransferase